MAKKSNDNVSVQLDMLSRHMQSQIDEMRVQQLALMRDLESMRRHVATIEKREAIHNLELSQKWEAALKVMPDLHRHIGKQPDILQGVPFILATGETMTGVLARAASVFCEGPLLDAVQRARVFGDSKEFVDMPLKHDPEVVMDHFRKLSQEQRESKEELEKFVHTWFNPAGSDCTLWTPPDFKENPPLLLCIEDPKMREWSLEINQLLKTLGRQQSEEVLKNPQRHSLLPRSHPMIVPGGRFREMYYWDTYWIVRGLLICDMKDTACGLVRSMLDTVDELGFYPNGDRIYYLDRTQPPMLTAMVRVVYEALQDKDWLAKALPVLEKEYRFWMDGNCGRLVEMPRFGRRGERETLNIYRSQRTTPRPESYIEDTHSFREAEPLGRSSGEVYQALCSSCESGWDHSCRWLEDGTGRVPLGTANLSTINTCHVIPADLNSILYDVEKTMAAFHREFDGDGPVAQKYEAAAMARARTMDSWLWAGDAYRDYRLDCGERSAVVSISDWAVPLWAGLHGPDNTCVSAMVASLKRSGIMRLCGVASTLVDSCGRTQWDAPNAWPPMMLMLIEGLDAVAGCGALSDCLSETWLRSNYIAWQRTGFMHEKYDVFEPGKFGAGGEYEPQVGFGWTNGVALALLVRQHRVPEDIQSPGDDEMLTRSAPRPLSRCLDEKRTRKASTSAQDIIGMHSWGQQQQSSQRLLSSPLHSVPQLG